MKKKKEQNKIEYQQVFIDEPYEKLQKTKPKPIETVLVIDFSEEEKNVIKL